MKEQGASLENSTQNKIRQDRIGNLGNEHGFGTSGFAGEGNGEFKQQSLAFGLEPRLTVRERDAMAIGLQPQ